MKAEKSEDRGEERGRQEGREGRKGERGRVKSERAGEWKEGDIEEY
jgi:hypothetical protein